MPLVKIHATARRVNDQRSSIPCFGQYRIHAIGHFTHTRDGILTMVQIPHITDDDGRFFGLPRSYLSHTFECGRILLFRYLFP